MANKTEFTVTFNFKTDRFEFNDGHIVVLKSTNYVDAVDEARDIMLINQWELDNADVGCEFDV